MTNAESINGTAFIACQIGAPGSPQRKRSDSVLKHVIDPVCSKPPFHLTIWRSDKDPTPGQITTQIIKNLVQARVVIVDLTGLNPNVYFELGVAQAFGKPIVLLVKSAEGLPFDVKSERTIVVGDGDVLGVDEAESAKESLEAALRVVLDPSYVPSNVVTETAGVRSLDALAPDNPVASELGLIREQVNEIHTMLRRLPPRPPDPSADSELRAMRGLIESLAESGSIWYDSLRSMIGARTSTEFDEWATELAERHGVKARAPDPVYGDEEPF